MGNVVRFLHYHDPIYEPLYEIITKEFLPYFDIQFKESTLTWEDLPQSEPLKTEDDYMSHKIDYTNLLSLKENLTLVSG